MRRRRDKASAGKIKIRQPEPDSVEPVAALNRKDYPHHHKHLAKLFATIGRKPRISSEHDSGTSLMAAVEAGHEITLLPSCVRGAAGRRFKLLELRPSLPPWSIVVLWRKDAETEPVRAFIAAALAKPNKNDRATRTAILNRGGR